MRRRVAKALCYQGFSAILAVVHLKSMERTQSPVDRSRTRLVALVRGLRPALVLALFAGLGGTALWGQTEPDLGGLGPGPGAGDLMGAVEQNLAEPYRIGLTDVLQVSVWKEPEVSIEAAQVRPDGKISVPLVGEVDVAGLTTEEAGNMLERRFKRFINTPVVTVIVREINSQLVFLVGCVTRPGAIRLVPGMTVIQAIAEGGGITDYAKRKKIFILRRVGDKRIQIPFDYDGVLNGRTPEQDIELQPGDSISTPCG